MDWLQYGVQWLHILFGILWFGASLTGNFIFVPAISKLPLDRQREVAASYGEVASRVLTFAAMAVITLGILRGTVFGSIQSLDALGTTYGLTWLVGLIAAIATFLWGKRVLEPAIGRMNAVSIAAAVLPDGRPSRDAAAAIDAVKRVAMLELIGFAVILSCMILMRFGY